MIGLIKDEETIIIQFWPVFGSERGIPKWAQLHIPINPKNYGEYGVAWSRSGIWISWGNTTYNSIKAFLNRR